MEFVIGWILISRLPDLDYAGNTNIFAETCTGVCYTDYVVGSGSNYDTAYFEVQYVRVYGSAEDTVISSSAGRSPAHVFAFCVAFATAFGLMLMM